MINEVSITPSILNADRDNLQSEIARISSVSDFIHLDIMDNLFVPNFTFDFQTAAEIIGKCPIPVDSHLMVEQADDIAIAYAEAGSASVTIHVEAVKNIGQTLSSIRAHGARAAIALKPGTEIDIYREYLDSVDMILIMTVEPGFGGQSFMEQMLPKIKEIKKLLGGRDIWIQVDGGISTSTIAMAREAGADTFVAGSAVFSAPDPAEMVNQLRALAGSTIVKP